MECLTTKLKASVNDDTLDFLGGIRFKKAQVSSPTADTQYIHLESYSTAECFALKGAGFYSDSTLSSIVGNKVVANGALLTWLTNGGEFVVKNKYDLKTIVIPSVDSINFHDLKNLAKIKNIELTGAITNEIQGSLADFADSLPADMEILMLKRCNLIGDISSLSHIALQRLEVNAQEGIIGDISSLNLSNLNILSIAETNITGTLESLVAKAINSGRTSGTIKMPYIKTIRKVTYQGIPLPSNSNVPSGSGNNTLSWTADGTIIFS